ncbi:MAG: hypothetical protein K2X71_17155 [Methylobacterium sp.]|uniref:hypothetical protein n=1 Tax=Methylobacterium sp. TaxID=409 RepID=UPI002584F444|nr:hypothetical protein [Methylobacterium sp.]MBY0297734.1 hypothetical protein [Methylobacterium sp.]
MRKLAILSAAAALSLGTMATMSAPAEARPGYRGGYGHGYHGGPYARGYGYRGGRRGISTGAAVGLGIAGLAAGAIAADAARRNGYGYYGAPAYRPAPAYGYYDDGY